MPNDKYVFKKSEEIFNAAQRLIPGGVNSPVRANRAVGGTPVFIERGEGPYVWDVDGNRYVDLVMSWGPLILGHRHPEVVSAIKAQCDRGMSYGMPTREEVDLAAMLVEAFPSFERVRLVNSGTEATMSAIRLARAFTGRPKIIKFAGCYHGHADYLLVKAGSGALTFGSPDSAGVPEDFAKHTLNLPYNDAKALREVFKEFGKEVAAVIVEPVAGNMGVVVPHSDFLEALATIPQQYGALLIYDEVITGFRLTWGGAQILQGIKPDITCLGKVIGGGLPIGAYGGRNDILDLVAPLGPVYQAGTLSGNPISVAAGLATLRTLNRERPYARLNEMCSRLCEGLREAAKDAGVDVQVQQAGSMFTVFFTQRPVTDLQSAKAADTRAFAVFFHEMRKRGVLLPPSQFEAAFLSSAHTDKDITWILDAAREAFSKVKKARVEEDTHVKPWPSVSRKVVGNFRIFDLAEEEFVMPEGGRHSFYILLSPDWVNVVPLTPEGRVVLIRQFRPGTCEVSIEVPGGMVDGGEDPAKAAERELEEETGYRPEKVILTGKVQPNPAFLRNTCYMFLALGARRVGSTNMDEGERIETFEATWEEIDAMIQSGRITHSLVLNALVFARKALSAGSISTQ